MLDERTDQGLIAIEWAIINYSKKYFASRSEVKKDFELYELEEITEFSTQSFDKHGDNILNWH